MIASLIGAGLPNGQIGGGRGSVRVLLVPGPIHYDFLIPANDKTRQVFGFSDTAQHLGADWIVVGWGARGFYTSVGAISDLAPSVIWKAVTGDDGVLRIDVAGALPDNVPHSVLSLSRAEFDALLAAITSDVVSGPPIATAKLSQTDQYFATKGRFHLLRTCNVWVAQKMRQAGLRFGRWTPVPFAVTLSVAMFQG